MGELIRRIGHDIRHQRNLDAYAAAVLVFAVACFLWSPTRWPPTSGGPCCWSASACLCSGLPCRTAVDPGTSRGVVIVEFHGFHNQVTNTRMHIELTRAESEQWYGYWIEQFERIWQAARPSREPGEHADSV